MSYKNLPMQWDDCVIYIDDDTNLYAMMQLCQVVNS